uniref:(northern house mosquito) hypothetical protein n=1 Tax=Culex pipiens TaxID=7175 RepID=A0A8D8MI53_CULPI
MVRWGREVVVEGCLEEAEEEVEVAPADLAVEVGARGPTRTIWRPGRGPRQGITTITTERGRFRVRTGSGGTSPRRRRMCRICIARSRKRTRRRTTAWCRTRTAWLVSSATS